MKGYVYILTNPSMPGIVKVGRTSRSVHGRAGELYQTGVPTPFEVFTSVLAPDCVALERLVHEQLAEHRVGPDREFFRCSASDAEEALQYQRMEQLYEWLHEFAPEHTIIEQEMEVDPGNLSWACKGTDVNPYEFIQSIEYLDPAAVQAAVNQSRERWKRLRQNSQQEGLIN
jgi:hypothetical protein